ncbi:MAG TPA: glutathione S-transferase family protein [Steroidobacteraceae bacterium]|nr:glutathione S-transferase family protein [Steroidobacteraceae bacterium]
MLELYIANKNYSSWSLRPWLLMRELAIPFEEHLLPFGDEALWRPFRARAPAGKVPCLLDGETLVWDSLAIVEYLAERHAGVWPRESPARAWARSAAAEMHSGFGELRNRCSMSCGVRVRLYEHPAALRSDLERLSALWSEGLRRFGGPHLAGSAFTAVDAFFAPVAFRVQSYALELDSTAGAYVQRLLALGAMRDWYASALAERFRDPPHELEIAAVGRITEDLRAS